MKKNRLSTPIRNLQHSFILPLCLASTTAFSMEAIPLRARMQAASLKKATDGSLDGLVSFAFNEWNPTFQNLLVVKARVQTPYAYPSNFSNLAFSCRALHVATATQFRLNFFEQRLSFGVRDVTIGAEVRFTSWHLGFNKHVVHHSNEKGHIRGGLENVYLMWSSRHYPALRLGVQFGEGKTQQCLANTPWKDVSHRVSKGIVAWMPCPLFSLKMEATYGSVLQGLLHCQFRYRFNRSWKAHIRSTSTDSLRSSELWFTELKHPDIPLDRDRLAACQRTQEQERTTPETNREAERGRCEGGQQGTESSLTSLIPTVAEQGPATLALQACPHIASAPHQGGQPGMGIGSASSRTAEAQEPEPLVVNHRPEAVRTPHEAIEEIREFVSKLEYARRELRESLQASLLESEQEKIPDMLLERSRTMVEEFLRPPIGQEREPQGPEQEGLHNRSQSVWIMNLRHDAAEAITTSDRELLRETVNEIWRKLFLELLQEDLREFMLELGVRPIIQETLLERIPSSQLGPLFGNHSPWSTRSYELLSTLESQLKRERAIARLKQESRILTHLMPTMPERRRSNLSQGVLERNEAIARITEESRTLAYLLETIKQSIREKTRRNLRPLTQIIVELFIRGEHEQAFESIFSLIYEEPASALATHSSGIEVSDIHSTTVAAAIAYRHQPLRDRIDLLMNPLVHRHTSLDGSTLEKYLRSFKGLLYREVLSRHLLEGGYLDTVSETAIPIGTPLAAAVNERVIEQASRYMNSLSPREVIGEVTSEQPNLWQSSRTLIQHLVRTKLNKDFTMVDELSQDEQVLIFFECRLVNQEEPAYQEALCFGLNDAISQKIAHVMKLSETEKRDQLSRLGLSPLSTSEQENINSVYGSYRYVLAEASKRFDDNFNNLALGSKFNRFAQELFLNEWLKLESNNA